MEVCLFVCVPLIPFVVCNQTVILRGIRWFKQNTRWPYFITTNPTIRIDSCIFLMIRPPHHFIQLQGFIYLHSRWTSKTTFGIFCLHFQNSKCCETKKCCWVCFWIKYKVSLKLKLLYNVKKQTKKKIALFCLFSFLLDFFLVTIKKRIKH